MSSSSPWLQAPAGLPSRYERVPPGVARYGGRCGGAPAGLPLRGAAGSCARAEFGAAGARGAPEPRAGCWGLPKAAGGCLPANGGPTAATRAGLLFVNQAGMRGLYGFRGRTKRWGASWGSKLPTGAYAAVSGVPKARSVAKACLARLALQAKIKNQYWP